MGAASESIVWRALSARCCLCFLAFASLVAVPNLATAQTWNGRSRASSNWSDAFNWVGGTIPVNDGLADITFEASSLWPSSNQDIANPFKLHSLAINSNYVFKGDPLSFQSPYPTNALINQNDSAVEFQNNLIFDSYTRLVGLGSTKFSGQLTGQALVIDNAGAVNFTGGADMQSLFANHATISFTAGFYQFNDITPWVIHEGAAVSITNGAEIASYGVSQMNGIGASVLISGQFSKFTSRSQEYYIATDSEGTVTVEDGGIFECENLRISVVNGGSGKLVVNAGGGALNENGYIGAAFGATGSVFVSGAGANWSNSKSLYLGGTDLIFNQGIGHITVSNNGILQVAGPTSIWTAGSTITIDGGTFFTDFLQNIGSNGNISLTDSTGGPALVLTAPGGQATFGGPISGSGSVRKMNSGLQTLSGANTWTGATIVDGGMLILPNSTSSSYITTFNGKLVLGASNFGSASLRATDSSMIEYTASAISGGILSGNATHNIDAVSSFTNSTFASDVSIIQNARLTLNNVTNSGQLTSNASLIANGGVNTSSGVITSNVALKVAGYQNNGSIIVNPGASLTNTAANLVNGPGSRMTVHPGGQIFLDTGSLNLQGTLLLNNGFISGPTNVSAGSLAKGDGIYGPVNIHNGGKFSPGVSPGAATTGTANWNSGGTYLFEIDNATGSPAFNWDLWNVSGNLAITAGSTPGTRFKISIASFTAGNVPGEAANFSFGNDYSWLIASATAGISGFDAARFTIDHSQFSNSIGTGSFNLSQVGNNLLLNFTPGPPQWNVDGNGIWSAAGNWLPTIVPNDVGVTANFLGKITAPRRVELDRDKSVGALVFDNLNSYTIAPGSGGTLSIHGGINPKGDDIIVARGQHTISADVLVAGNVNAAIDNGASLHLSGQLSIASGTTLSQSNAGILTISGPQGHEEKSTFTATAGRSDFDSNAGTPASFRNRAVANLAININGAGHVVLGADQDLRNLDIAFTDAGPQRLDLNSPTGRGEFRSLRIYADDLDAAKLSIYEALTNAHNPRSADPTDGIYDRSLDFRPNSAIGLAKLPDANGDPHIFIRPTRVGDLNVDGAVTISDFIDLASNFNSSGASVTWQEGDLNYDHAVTISDFIDLAANFNSNYGGETLPISLADLQTLNDFALTVGAASIPEPLAISVILACVIPAFCTPRKRPSRQWARQDSNL